MTEGRDTISTDPPPIEGEMTRRFRIIEKRVDDIRSERDELKGALKVIRALLAIAIAFAALIASGTGWLVLTTIQSAGRVEQLERRVDRIEARP